MSKEEFINKWHNNYTNNEFLKDLDALLASQQPKENESEPVDFHQSLYSRNKPKQTGQPELTDKMILSIYTAFVNRNDKIHTMYSMFYEGVKQGEIKTWMDGYEAATRDYYAKP